MPGFWGPDPPGDLPEKSVLILYGMGGYPGPPQGGYPIPGPPLPWSGTPLPWGTLGGTLGGTPLPYPGYPPTLGTPLGGPGGTPLPWSGGPPYP